MPDNSKKHSAAKMILAVLLVLAAALYFRTYSLHPAPDLDKQVRKSLMQNLKEHISQSLYSDLSKYPPKTRKEIINKRVEEILQKDPVGFENMVRITKQRVTNQRNAVMSPQYLSGADPYYYYSLTEKVIRDGMLGPAAKPGKFTNDLRTAPDANMDVNNLHPFVGAFFAKLAHWINPRISLMRVTAFVSLFFVVLIVPFYFLMCRLFGADLFSIAAGCLVFMLAPMVIQRSSYGWYDTDIYNFLFPVLIMWTYFYSIKKDSKQSYVWGFLGGFITGFYPLFWQGWALIFTLMVCGGIAVAAAGILKRDKFKRRYCSLIYTAAYIGSTAFFGWLFLGSDVIFENFSTILNYFKGATGASVDVWPNLLAMVGETESVSPVKWIYLSSHYGAAIVGLIGLAGACFLYFKDREAAETRRSLFVVIYFIPVLLFSLKSQRITLFSVFPFSLLVVLGASYIRRLTASLSRKMKGEVPGKICRAAVVLILFGMIVPRSLIGAHVAGLQTHMIMNNTWHDVLTELEAKSPENSIVYSWWPPGYFISAIAHRAVVIDGGTHGRRENFWVAKAFMSRDEKKAAGFLRMLAADGNGAAGFLESKGLNPDETVDLLDKIIALKRKDALKELPAEWPDDEKNTLLNKIFGDSSLRPGYVLVYEDLLQKNLELQILSGWNFKRAQEILSSRTKNVKDLRADYIQKMLRISAQSLPYETNIAIKQKKGTVYIFQNSLVYDAKENTMHMPLFGGRQTPVSFYYQEDGHWKFKHEADSTMPVSAILMKAGGKVSVDMVHNDLLSTFLFQLYYFNAENYSFIDPVARKYNADTGSNVAVFYIHWDKISG